MTEIFEKLSLDGKQHRSSFSKSGRRRATQQFKIVHGDVFGKIEAKSLSGAEYFVTFIDDKSKFVLIYILKNKWVVVAAWAAPVLQYNSNNTYSQFLNIELQFSTFHLEVDNITQWMWMIFLIE